jgi:hypothetical protein
MSHDRPNSALDAAALARVRRRYRLVRSLFWFSVLLIPLGCVGPAAMTLAVPDSWVLGLLLAAVLLPCTGLGLFMLMIADWVRYGRSLRAAEQATALGLRFTERPSASEVAWLTEFELCGHGTSPLEFRNLLTGVYQGVALTVLDYEYALEIDELKPYPVHTVVMCWRAVRGVADFVLLPKRWLDRLGEHFGSHPLEVPGVPEFNRRFMLHSENPAAAFDCLTTEVVAFLLEEQDWSVEVQNGSLAVHRYRKFLPPAAWPRFVRGVLQLAALLRRAAGVTDQALSQGIIPADPGRDAV